MQVAFDRTRKPTNRVAEAVGAEDPPASRREQSAPVQGHRRPEARDEYRSFHRFNRSTRRSLRDRSWSGVRFQLARRTRMGPSVC